MSPERALDPDALVRRLGLLPHPEGGFYRETFRAAATVTLPDGRVRSACTAIHFLLPEGGFSAWHRVGADETWHHYGGAPVLLHRLGGLGTVRLDADRPQAVVPAGVWQAAEPVGGPAWCGCVVAPGFEFEDFELGSRAELEAGHPAEAALIRRLTRG